MSVPGRKPPSRSGSGSSQTHGSAYLQHSQPQQGMWNNLSMVSSFPPSNGGYDRYPGPSQPPSMSRISIPTSSSFHQGNGLPMSMFLPQTQQGNGYGEGPRRDSHQAVEMAASALANLGNGSSTNPNPGPSGIKDEITEAGPSQTIRRQVDEAAGHESAAGPGAGNKKKRKPKQGENMDEDGRRKTARACDQCRTKKIRCEIIIAPDSEDAHPRGMCKHCQHTENECTFYMPIAETRFKKRKVAEESQTSSPQNKLSPEPHPTTVPESTSVKERRTSQADAQQYGAPYTLSPNELGPPSISSDRVEISEHQVLVPKAGMAGRVLGHGGRVEGPTSLSYILHSTASLPRQNLQEYDIKNHQTWQFTTDDGDGIIRVCNPPTSSSFKQGSGYTESSPSESSNQPQKPVLTAALISTLVNSYFTHIAPLFPIVNKKEFVKGGNPPPLLLYAMAGAASTRRGVKKEVFNAIRAVINGLIRNNDVLSDPSLTNVQALLILNMAADIHAQPTSTAIGASVTRISAAIRMAQNLGLHRESVATSNDPEEMTKIELKRRVWAVCVIFDRWVAACLGLPMLIDITDCDCLLPSPYEITSNPDGTTAWHITEHQPYAILTEHLKLSILLGRVLKCVYSPVGLTQTTNEQLSSLINDMNEWQVQLPAELQHTDQDSDMGCGLLHLGHVAMQFLFWRTFMRLNYSLPAHVKLSMDVATWSKLVKWSTDAINWLRNHEEAIDTVFIYAYAINNAALIQYHTWVRRCTPESLEMLKILRDVVQRWEDAVQPDHMSIRRKTIEIMTLLYEAAKKVHTPNGGLGTAALNPTPGLKRRDPELFKRIIWKPDPDDPGKGVFVATDMGSTSRQLERELPPGILVTQSAIATNQEPILQPSNNPNMQQQPGQQPHMNQQHYNMLNGANGDHPQTGPNMTQLANQGTSVSTEPVSYLNLNPGLQYFPQLPNAPENGETDMTMLLSMLDQNNAEALTQAQLLDNSLLSGLPPTFDFDAWSEYFGRFDFANMPFDQNSNFNQNFGYTAR